MKSPVRHLMANNLGNSVFTIAPERKAEFDRTLGSFDLIYTSNRLWEFYANPEKREIFVSRGAVELIWCASLAHYQYYTRLIRASNFARPALVDPNSDELVGQSLSLLRWAIQCQIDKDTADDWPQGLPEPQVSPKDGAENAANELTLVSCAFLLHHELAHIRLRHSASVDHATSISQEKDADIEAANWVLGGIPSEGPMFFKRLLGCVQAFLLATALGIYQGNLGGVRHPFSYDRLMSLLDRYVGSPSDPSKWIAFVVLSLHFQNSGRKPKRHEFADPDEALNYLCDQLAHEFQNGS